jgi:hypothetical protein
MLNPSSPASIGPRTQPDVSPVARFVPGKQRELALSRTPPWTHGPSGLCAMQYPR